MDGERSTDLEISRLRTEIRDMELRLMDRIVRFGWLWVVAINLASLALAGVFMVALNRHG